MKKHPVDDLFKRNLEGMQRTPSENAWLKIQEKQPTGRRLVNRRPAVWGWYAAAGVAAAVMGGYLVWQNQQGMSPGSTRPQQTIAAAKPAQKDSAVSPIKNSNAAVEQFAQTEKTGNALENQAVEGPRVARKQAVLTQSVKKFEVEPTPVQNAPVMALNDKPTSPVNAMQPEPLKNSVTQDIKTLPDEPAVSQVNKPEPEPTRTIVVAVETGTNEAEEKPRNTRFARVFRQLKNARAGEKVDWEEVGFNPKDLVAGVDDRLRNKEDRSSDKDHPKDKTKL